MRPIDILIIIYNIRKMFYLFTHFVTKHLPKRNLTRQKRAFLLPKTIPSNSFFFYDVLHKIYNFLIIPLFAPAPDPSGRCGVNINSTNLPNNTKVGIHLNFVTVFQNLGRNLRANDAGNSQLTTHNCGMTCNSTLICNNRTSYFH